MDQTVYKIAMAGFFHDIGKIAGKEELDVSQQYIDNHADLYLPFYNNNFSHHHAVYTAAFIEQMGKWLPEELNRGGWGEGDSFINLAAGHHKPKSEMQWIVAVADRISSGFDRAEYDEKYNQAIQPRDYKKTRLVPILENLSAHSTEIPDSSEAFSYCYPLRELDPKSIFPGLKRDLVLKDNKEASREYLELFAGFADGLKKLYHRKENIALWFEHFESLTMRFASSVPSARAGQVIPDVSLYDHLKTTAAIAAALYLFHKLTDTMTIDDIKDDARKKFIIVSGDFYGIQNFIFSSGETQTSRSKMLRGRSFAVSLFSELAADMLCRKIGLPSVSVLLNAAGKFTLLAPNTDEAKQSIIEVEQSVNQWLVDVAYGETAMGITCVEASADDFVKGRFETIWDDLSRRMDTKKYQKIDLHRFAGAVPGYLDRFQNDLAHPMCPFCRKRPSHSHVEGSSFVKDVLSGCALCRDHIFLGENLVKKNHVAILTSDADIKGGDANRLMEPIFGKYQVAFLEGALSKQAEDGSLLRYWNVSTDAAEKFSPITTRFINGYVPVYSPEDQEDERLLAGRKSEAKKLKRIDEIELGMPKTFGHIANQALRLKDGQYLGIEALGVLKADVDNLGLLIACGLKGERFTLSRLSTLSRQLNYFFSVYIPHLLMTESAFHNVYTVFAGGDDLFLIGPWNQLISLAIVINERFRAYVCQNEEIHLSAGIVVQKANRPVSFMAEEAEKALSQAKDAGRNRVTVFGETVVWDQMIQLSKIKEKIESWLEGGWINKAMLYRLNQVISMAGQENRLMKKGKIYLQDMECTKWRALLSYSVARNVARELPQEKRKEVSDTVRKQLVQWLMDFGSSLKIAIWEILYNHRVSKL